MSATYGEWNPKLLEVFTPAQMEHLSDVFMYLNYENHLPYQESMYEASRDDGSDEVEQAEYEENPPWEIVDGVMRMKEEWIEKHENYPDPQEYYVLRKIHEKLVIHHHVEYVDELPEDLWTNPRYSCNASNKSI